MALSGSNIRSAPGVHRKTYTVEVEARIVEAMRAGVERTEILERFGRMSDARYSRLKKKSKEAPRAEDVSADVKAQGA